MQSKITLLTFAITLLVTTVFAQDKETVTIWWPQSTSGDTAQCLIDTSTPLFNEKSEKYEIE